MNRIQRGSTRRWYVPIVSFVIIVAIFVFSLPTLLSFSFCKPLIEKKLSVLLKGEVHFNQLHLSWFTSQYIEELDYKSFDGAYSLHLKNLTLSSSLFKYLITPHLSQLSESGTTEITAPVLFIHKKVAHSSSVKLSPAVQALAHNLSIINGAFIVQEPTLTEFYNLNAHVKFHGNTCANFMIQGDSRLGTQEGHFNIHFAPGHNSIPETLQVMLSQFPLAGIDAFLNKPGFFTSLVGPVLNAQLTLNKTEASPLFSVVASADRLKVAASVHIIDHSLSLIKPASITLMLTPQTFESLHQLLALKTPLCMTRNASLQLVLNALEVPSFDLKNLSYQAKIETSPLAFTWCNTAQPISITALSLTSSTKNLSESIDLALNSSFNYVLKTPSQINTELQLSHIFSQSWVNAISHLRVDVVKFPMVLIDTFLHADHTLVHAFGETMNIHIAPNRNIPREYIAEIDSARLQISELRAVLKDGIALAQPATITYLPDHNWMVQHLDSSYLTFSKTGKLYGTLETCFLPIGQTDALLNNTPRFTFHLSSDDIAVRTPMLAGLLTFRNTALSVSSAEVGHFDIKTSASVLYFDELIPERELFGNSLKIELSTEVAYADLKKSSLPRIKCLIHNNKSNISLLASLEDHFTKLSLLQPMTITLHPAAAEIAEWTKIHYPSLSFVLTPIAVNVSLKPLFLNQPIFKQLSLNAQAALARVDLVDKVFLRDFAFSDCLAQIALDAEQKTCLGTLESHVQSKGTPAGSIALHLSSNGYQSFESLKKLLHFSASCKGVSSYLLDTLCEYKNAFYVLLGHTFEGSADFQHKNDLLNMTVAMESPQLALSGSAVLSKEALKIEKAIECDLKLQTESFAALEQIYGPSLENFSLTEPALVHITAKNLYWPLSQPLHLGAFSLKTFVTKLTDQLSQSYFHIVAQADHLNILSNRLQKTTALQHFHLESTKTAPANPLLFQISSAITEDPSNTTQGEFSSTISLQPTKDYQGRPMLLSKIDAHLKHFPTLLVDSLFEMMGFTRIPPSVVLGQEINATLNTDLENLSGHIDCEVTSTDSQGNFNAYLTDGVLKLYKPIRATLNITPALAGAFLNNMNISLSLAKNPLQLFISDQGFFFPLEPFNISKVQIRQASLNLGKILCNNRGNPMEISGFFKLNQDRHQALSLWFAPMDFSLSNGSLQIDRTEVLFNDAYQIAFWGRIDLAHRYVQMVLGLTEQSLRKALGIRGLPKSFVVQVPMTGPIDNVKVDTDVATTRIAFLLAKSSGITDHAGLWGNIVDTLGDFANDQSTVPPAKPPFPWKEALSRYEAEEHQKRTAHIIR